MEVVYARCVGIDVGKRDVKVCVRVQGAGSRRTSAKVTTWGSSMPQLVKLRAMLVTAGVQRVVMESTSDYWRPVFYVLGEQLDVVLVQASAVKAIPGRKSDLLTELPDRILRLSPGAARGVARLPGYGPRRGCTARVVVVGGAAARVA